MTEHGTRNKILSFLYKQQDRKEVRLSQFKSIITAYEHFKTFESELGVRQKDS
jgi:hypothetical protein